MRQTKDRRMVTTISAIILNLLILFVLSGCISGRSDISYGSKGPAVGAETLRQVKLGETSKEWLLCTLGEPSSERGTSEGREILKYQYTKKVDSSFEISPFLDLDDKKEEHTTLYFEVKDGVVTNFWKEK